MKDGSLFICSVQFSCSRLITIIFCQTSTNFQKTENRQFDIEKQYEKVLAIEIEKLKFSQRLLLSSPKLENGQIITRLIKFQNGT